MKIVINKCFGGYSVSEAVYKELGVPWDGYGFLDVERTNERLIVAVELLGDAANGMSASLRVIEIPDGVEYTIEDYDGVEHVAEVHRAWG